jgi:alkylation response protein AidB-like acyl-CoA dehydrogenase
MGAPGVEVRPLTEITGETLFNEVFLDDVFVPDHDVLGEVNAGWSVAMATTGSERGLTLRSPGRFRATAGRLLDLYRDKGTPAHLRHRVVDAWMRAEAYQLFTLETVTRLVDGGKAGAESSINKIWWSELDVELHEIALDLIGADLDLGAPWEKGYQFALSGPIYAGTNEIQRNIAAERVLGLPR